MNKNHSIEILFSKIYFALIVSVFFITINLSVHRGYFMQKHFFISTGFLVGAGILNQIKCIVLKKYERVRENLFLVFRLAEALVIAMGVTLFGLHQLTWLLIIFPLSFVCYKFYADYSDKNKKQIAELQEKCLKLTSEFNEKNNRCIVLENEKVLFEKRNRELLGSVAEYYTLQHVSQVINTTLDIKELLKDVNDIIIGVMGVSHSTLLLYDENKNKLKISITSVVSSAELAVLMDNINNNCLHEVIQKEEELVENNVDPDVYTFARGRDVKSFICAPVSTKSRKLGLILAEHKFINAFTENNARILSIIGQQVGFAMENAELYRQMKELAITDGLTGIYNRHYFHDRLQVEFKYSSEGKYDLSLLICDIDHFKRFNDTYGHLFGDKVLISIVNLLKECIRNTDIFARFGGEEFILLLPRTNLKQAYEKADMLREKVSKAIIKDELVSVNVTVSFGVSSFPLTASTENELIRAADDALYEAKNSGRNCVRMAKTLVKV